MPRSRHKGRSLTGILLLDKPSGISSNSALQKVKRLFNAAKAGHTGSLDPLATGLLVICFGKATKISDYLLSADKMYIADLKLGITTDTGDSDGEVTSKKVCPKLSNEYLIKTLKSFEGEIQQIPPMYSAIKHHGKRLYKLARNGEKVTRQARTIHIYKIVLLEHNTDRIKIQVHCSKGTYVRTLAEDIGERLGCGAHIAALRRVALGPFQNMQMHTLKELENAVEREKDLDINLLSVDYALKNWPFITLATRDMKTIHHGHAIQISDIPNATHVRIYDTNDKFYGIGKVLSDGRIAPKCLS